MGLDWHRLADHAAGTIMRAGRLYAGGFGGRDRLDALVARVAEYGRDSPLEPLHVRWQGPVLPASGARVRRGRFVSPAADLLPPESAEGVLELRLPAEDAGERPPVCLLLAATAEEGFGTRRRFGADLLRAGIGTLSLENPYYGERRPRGQIGPALRTVADQFAMNLATVMEARQLLCWLRDEGYRHVGASGYSQGGMMSAFGAALVDFPVAVAPRGAARAAEAIFTRSALSRAFHWRKLAEEAGGEEPARRYFTECLRPVDVGRHPPPVAPECAILVSARSDGFVPASDTEALHAHWPGSELRWLDGGHLTAALWQRRAHVQAIRDAFTRLRER
ncbi:MAG: alpha/beta hydrolase family protein [Polyangiales bacterium]